MLNFALMKNPLNWLTIILMVLIGGMLFNLVMNHWENN